MVIKLHNLKKKPDRNSAVFKYLLSTCTRASYFFFTFFQRYEATFSVSFLTGWLLDLLMTM